MERQGDGTCIKKGPWTAEEDEVLLNYVNEHGPRDWSSIRSKGLLPRTGKSCRLRWVNKLRPNLKTKEHVVDGVANFMARCIMSNPKAQDLTPEQLQKTVAKALGGISKLEKILGIWHAGKLFYALSTWGLALAGLYQTRGALKLAAMGVHTTSKVILRAL